MAFRALDVDHDIPDGIGCNAEGTIRYIDKDLFRAILDGSADTGLTPEQVIECLVANIEAERETADANPDMPWHDVSLEGHKAEAEKVESFGGNVTAYDQALAPLFIACKDKKPKNVPADLMDLESSHGEAEAQENDAAEGQPSTAASDDGATAGGDAASGDVQPARG